MRCILAAVAFLGLVLLGGCSSDNYRMSNPDHFCRHFTCICDDLHDFHVDVDRCIFGIYEARPQDQLTPLE